MTIYYVKDQYCHLWADGISLFDTNDELKYKKVGISEKFLCKGTRHDVSWVRQFVGIDHTHDRQQGAGRFIAMGKIFTAASVRQPTPTDTDADVDVEN